MSSLNFVLSCVEREKSFITSGPGFDQMGQPMCHWDQIFTKNRRKVFEILDHFPYVKHLCPPRVHAIDSISILFCYLFSKVGQKSGPAVQNLRSMLKFDSLMIMYAHRDQNL